MRFVALVSGGKDSVYSICKCIEDGHDLVGLIYMQTTEQYSDSYMFQTVGNEVATLLGECFACPLFVHETSCKPLSQDLHYCVTNGDEVEDLYAAISEVREALEFDAVCSGAILSSYQKNRVENVCQRLGCTSLAPLWNRDQKELLDEMIESGLEARLIKIASPYLKEECLGMTLVELRSYFLKNPSKYDINYCGEGGEYETVVFDCSKFVKKIRFQDSETYAHPEEADKNGCVYYKRYTGLSTIYK